MKCSVVLLVALCFGFAAAKCKYQRSGEWTACAADGLKTKTDALKADKSDATCHPTRNISKLCREDCQYERRRLASWAACDPLSNTIAGTRQLVSGDSCPAQVTELFDCRIQRRFDRKSDRRAAKKNLRKAQRKAQRRQNKQAKRQNKMQNKQQKRMDRQQKRQQRRQNRPNIQSDN